MSEQNSTTASGGYVKGSISIPLGTGNLTIDASVGYKGKDVSASANGTVEVNSNGNFVTPSATLNITRQSSDGSTSGSVNPCHSTQFHKHGVSIRSE